MEITSVEKSKRSVAVMQPYLFPYLGYFHLIESCDFFVFYDDVNFIKKGWINRNRILLRGEPHTFTVPLKSVSQNALINNVGLHEFQSFSDDFLKKIHHAYHKAKYYQDGLNYIMSVLNSDCSTIDKLAISSIKNFYRWLGHNKNFKISSNDFSQSAGIGRNERLYHIAEILGATCFHNATGGKSIYDKDEFNIKGIELKFISSELRPYYQDDGNNFHAGLSIIDVVMHNSVQEINALLKCYCVE